MKKQENMPLWAYWALLGIHSRKKAMIFFFTTLFLSLLATCIGIVIKDYSLATLLFIPLWYWISIKWVDVYASWE